jgi:integrase
MANKTVTLVRLCKTASGWRRLPVVMGRNGKLRPGFALVNGEPTFMPEGHYEIRTYQGTKTLYKNVGDDPAEALAAQQRESHLLKVKDSAKAAGVEIVGQPGARVQLLLKGDEFIERHKAKGQKQAAINTRIAIDNFLDATGLKYADQVTEASVLKFYSYLRKMGNRDRTVYNKHVSVFGWFKWLGLDVKKLADGYPSFTEKEVVVYHKEDLTKLFSICNPYQKIVFETLLKTGMRMQEAMHLEWPNVDFRSKTIRVREYLDDDSPDVRIKDRAERTVPMPDDLAHAIKVWKLIRPNTNLVLGTVNDTPNRRWILMLKRCVKRAGLNCNRCKGCQVHKECYRWKIHQFRSTYITTLLRNGVDVRTVMSFSGHSNMATVLRYLSPAEGASMQKKLSSIEWT